ncbi:MAG: FAD-dependent oxidoreductase [Nocardioides sp.]
MLEGSTSLGGMLRGAEVAGVTVDVGAEAMLNRRPEGVALAQELGLEVVHPAVAESYVWLGDRLLRLPRTLMGVPLDPDQPETAAVLTDSGLARLRAERALPASRLTADVSVGELVAERCGREVVDRLVEPLLGGVYAGHADLISARAALPRLVEYFSRGSILAQAGTIPTTYAVPVFAGIPGGMARLPSALVDSGRFAVRTAAVVRELRAVAPAVDGARFELVVGSAAAPETLRARAVVLATPAAPTARLLTGVAPEAPGSWPGSSRRRWRWSRSPSAPTSCPTSPDRGCSSRRARAGRSRRRRSPSRSGTGCARRAVAAPTAVTCCSCGPRWAATARRRRSSAPTRSW